MRTFSWALLAAPLAFGLLVGALFDRVPDAPPPLDNGYYRVAADLHVHAFPGDGLLAPWNLGREARRRGLDAVAITNHNQVLTARLGRLFSRFVGGSVIIGGEEVSHPGYHILALGTRRAVDWRQSPAQIVADIGSQGGVAIAAHPSRAYWPSFDQETLRALDGAELSHPIVETQPTARDELQTFYERGRAQRAAAGRPFAAIGASDLHGLGPLGKYRTVIHARRFSEAGILAAIREGRTQAIGPDARHSPVEAGGARAPSPLRRAAAFVGLLGILLLMAVGPAGRENVAYD